MSYTMLEEKLKMLPEECLDEVSQYVEFILFRQEHKSRKSHSGLSAVYPIPGKITANLFIDPSSQTGIIQSS